MQKRIFLEPVITEKSQKNTGNKEYTFLVDPSASKYTLKNAVEEVFGVTVKKIRTKAFRGKEKRRGKFYYRTPDKKIAVVRVGEKDKIELFETEKKGKGKKQRGKSLSAGRQGKK